MSAGTDARRSPMKTIAICGAFLLAAIFAPAQEKPVDTSKELQPTHTGLDEGAAKPLPTQHEHHGFMQEGMHHAVAKGDRKSTRLNSSHGYISYAVFCLKKKKEK